MSTRKLENITLINGSSANGGVAGIDGNSTNIPNFVGNNVTLVSTGSATDFLNAQGNYVAETGSGDVVGPVSAIDSNITSFDTTTGKLIKDSGVASSLVTTNQTNIGTNTTNIGTNTTNIGTNSSDIADRIVGPVSSTDGNIVFFSGATGKIASDDGINSVSILNRPGTSVSLASVDYTVLTTDSYIRITAVSGDKLINLFTAVGNLDKEIVIKDESGDIDNGTNTVSIETFGSETIDGDTDIALSVPFTGITLKSNGANWFVASLPGLASSSIISGAGDNKLPGQVVGSTDPILVDVPGSPGRAFQVGLRNTDGDNQLCLILPATLKYQYQSKSIINGVDFNTSNDSTASPNTYYFNTTNSFLPLPLQILANDGDIQILKLNVTQNDTSTLMDLWVMNSGDDGFNRFKWTYTYYKIPIIA